MDKDNVSGSINSILSKNFWPENLKPNKCYSRQHDDTDGLDDGILSVIVDEFGDAYIKIDDSKTLRFRIREGGGNSIKVRNALIILAEAICLENLKR